MTSQLRELLIKSFFQFVGVETCTTVLADWKPGFRRYKAVITLGFCVFCYIIGLAHVTEVGLKGNLKLCTRWIIFVIAAFYQERIPHPLLLLHVEFRIVVIVPT